MSVDAHDSPEQAIRAFLTTGNKYGPAHPLPAAGWHAGPDLRTRLIARPDSIRFGKMRQTATRQLHTVTFENTSGERMRLYCCVRRTDDGGWLFDGGAGGGVGGEPRRSQAWVNLCGGGPRHFYAAGRVLDDGGATTLVSLHTANGLVLEDSVDDEHIVLFLSDDDIQVPLDVELWDGAGHLVAHHQAMNS